MPCSKTSSMFEKIPHYFCNTIFIKKKHFYDSTWFKEEKLFWKISRTFCVIQELLTTVRSETYNSSDISDINLVIVKTQQRLNDCWLLKMRNTGIRCVMLYTWRTLFWSKHLWEKKYVQRRRALKTVDSFLKCLKAYSNKYRFHIWNHIVFTTSVIGFLSAYLASILKKTWYNYIAIPRQ